MWTKDYVTAVLSLNEGFRTETQSSNGKQTNVYTISNGKMYRRISGKVPYSSDRYSRDDELSLDDARPILKREAERGKIKLPTE